MTIISLDSFYRPLSEREREHVQDYNFDHPDACDWELLGFVLVGWVCFCVDWFLGGFGEFEDG